MLNQFMGGGIICTTEPLDIISEDRLLEYRRILPVLPRQVRTVTLMQNGRFPSIVDVYIPSMDAHYICIINWDDEESLRTTFSLEEVLPGFVMEESKYMVCDYYNQCYFSGVNCKDILELDDIAPHGANVYKITAMGNRPQVVASTGHYSMGGEFKKLEYVDGKLLYSVENAFDCKIMYKIWMPDDREVTLVAMKGRNEGIIK